MSKKFEICSATYNIALNQDANDVYRTGCAHLYHFLHVNGNHGKSGGYKPMTLKMHLELNELIEETEEQIVEPSNSNNPERPFVQQPEAKFQSLQDSLQAKDDIVNKIIERLEKLEYIVHKATDIGNNTINHESNNVLLNISDNVPIQSTLQLEAKLKTLEDALQAKDDVVNKVMERLEKLGKNLSNNIVTKETDVGNNIIDHERNNALLNSSEKSAKQSVQQHEKEIKALKDRIEKLEHNKGVNETADIGNPTIHDNSTDKQQQQKEVQFDRDNLVSIWYINYSESSLETALHNVIKYAKEMDLSLTPDQIKHIDVRRIYEDETEDTLVYYVFFRTRTIKEAFLMKSDILIRSPYYISINNEQESQIVYIRNFKSSYLSKDNAIVNIIGLAKQMGLTLMGDQIYHIDAFPVNATCLVWSVGFSTTQLKDEFLKKSHILKELPDTKSIEIY